MFSSIRRVGAANINLHGDLRPAMALLILLQRGSSRFYGDGKLFCDFIATNDTVIDDDDDDSV